MTLEALYKKKTVSALFKGSVIKLKVNILPAAKPMGDGWQDCTWIQMTGRYNDFILKTDIIHNQENIDSLEENGLVILF